jgi:hypothetical protein
MKTFFSGVPRTMVLVTGSLGRNPVFDGPQPVMVKTRALRARSLGGFLKLRSFEDERP